MNNFAEYLQHHGIKGMKWGVRRYQYTDGSLTSAGRRRYNQPDAIITDKNINKGKKYLDTHSVEGYVTDEHGHTKTIYNRRTRKEEAKIVATVFGSMAAATAIFAIGISMLPDSSSTPSSIKSNFTIPTSEIPSYDFLKF